MDVSEDNECEILSILFILLDSSSSLSRSSSQVETILLSSCDLETFCFEKRKKKESTSPFSISPSAWEKSALGRETRDLNNQQGGVYVSHVRWPGGLRIFWSRKMIIDVVIAVAAYGLYLATLSSAFVWVRGIVSALYGLPLSATEDGAVLYLKAWPVPLAIGRAWGLGIGNRQEKVRLCDKFNLGEAPKRHRRLRYT